MMSDKFVIIGKKNCTWCDKAIKLLDSRVSHIQYFDVGSYPDILPLLDGFRLFTVPQIWHVDEDGPYHVGGYQDLVEYLEFEFDPD